MKITDVMTRAVDFVEPSATVQAAATQMAELDVGAVFIGSAEALEGVLTDRDIILRVVVEGLSPASVLVRDVMSSDVVTCSEDETIEKALVTMRQRQLRRMPVLDEAGRACGVVTLGDVARHVEEPEGILEMLREATEPHRSRTAPPPDAEGEQAQPAGAAPDSEDGPAAAAA